MPSRKELGLWGWTSQASPLTSCVTVGNSFPLCEPWCPPLSGGPKGGAPLPRGLVGLLGSKMERVQCPGNGPQMTVAGATVNAKTHQGQDNPIPHPEGATNNTGSHVPLCPGMNCLALCLLQGDWGKERAFLNNGSRTTCKMEIQIEPSRSGEALRTRASCCQNPQPKKELSRWEVLPSLFVVALCSY